MWPFTRSKPQQPAPQEPSPASVDVQELAARVAYDQQQLRIEWADTLDKIQRWAARQAARDRHALEKLSAQGGEGAGMDGGQIVAPTAAETREQQKARLRAQLRAQRGA